MRVKFLILVACLLTGVNVLADTQEDMDHPPWEPPYYAVANNIKTETNCFVYRSSSKNIRYSMIIKSYYDPKIGKEIGAFVQYGRGKNIIPLIFDKKIDTDVDEPAPSWGGNFRLSRWEVVDGKITGRYVIVQTGSGIYRGRYIEYTNFKTQKTVTLNASLIEDCER